MLAPESFTLCVEFVAICVDFNVTWEFGGNQIVNDLNTKIVISNPGNSRYRTCLTIIQSSETNSGNYTMKVTSATGSVSANITATIISKLLFVNSVMLHLLL